MHEVGENRPLKSSSNNQKLHSVKFFHFNAEWAHVYHQDPKPTVNTSDQTSHTNRPSIQKPQNNDSTYSSNHKRNEQMYGSRLVNNVSDTSQIYPKKKANSQLQSYKKLQLSALQNRFSKPTQEISHEHTISHHIQRPDQENQLVVNSIKLSTLKLPEIKTNTPKDTHFIKKIKLQNLRVINIQDRIKTMKFSPEKDEPNESFNSEVTTELLKNKIKNISKLNKKLLDDRNRTEGIQTQIQKVQTDEATQKIFKVNKKMFKKSDLEQKNQLPIKKFSKIESIKKIQQVKEISGNEKIKTKENVQSEDDQKNKESSLPKIEIYDKKMKIGRKKRSQEDRIRALLLKTLQKTKGTDYIAQQGTSQKKNTPRNSMPHTKRSLSKQQNQQQNERVPLVLASETTNLQSPSKKSSFKRAEIQKLKKSLNPMSKQPEHASTYVKNKKFVQMVREVENKRNRGEILEQIKQEKTLSKEQNEDSSINEGENIKVQVPEQLQGSQWLQMPVPIPQVCSEVSQNEFLPNSARLKLKEMI